jgi:hypothetical protein
MLWPHCVVNVVGVVGVGSSVGELVVDGFFTILHNDVIDSPIYSFFCSHDDHLSLLPTHSLYESFKFGTLQPSVTVCIEGIPARWTLSIMSCFASFYLLAARVDDSINFATDVAAHQAPSNQSWSTVKPSRVVRA